MASNTARTVGVGLMLVVMVLASVFLLWRLGKDPLQDYDESTYAQVVHEARMSSNFISFTFGGADFFKKPPLMFWLMGASESIFGETPFAMRLPFAFTGIALIAVIMLLAYDTSASYFAAAFAGAIALTTAPLMETARQVRMDVPVALCIMAAIWSFARGLEQKRWFLFFGLFTGFAVLCKSVIAIFAFVFVFFLTIILRRFDIFKERYFWYGIGIFLLVALPWHIAETLQYGAAFWQQYIGVEVVARTQQNLFWTVTITNADLWNYIKEFYEPWLLVFFVTLPLFIFRWKSFQKKSRATILASLAAVFCMLGVFLFSVTKAPTYLVPLYPFVTLVIALSYIPLFSKKYAGLFFSAAVVLVVFGGMLTVYNAYHYNPYYSTVLDMAIDEQSIGNILADTPVDMQWYVYSDPNLGSIMFYSQRLNTLALAPGMHVPSGTSIVIDSSAVGQFGNTFPELKTTPLYQGSEVTLLRTDTQK